MDGWYGERRGLSCRFLSPEPLSCNAERGNRLRSDDWPGKRLTADLSPEPLSCSAGRWNALPSDEWKVNYFHHLKFN